MSLRQPVDKSVWLNAPTAVNAYYDPQFNQFGTPEPFRGTFAIFHD
jgi:predicted metalloendopeptidase